MGTYLITTLLVIVVLGRPVSGDPGTGGSQTIKDAIDYHESPRAVAGDPSSTVANKMCWRAEGTMTGSLPVGSTPGDENMPSEGTLYDLRDLCTTTTSESGTGAQITLDTWGGYLKASAASYRSGENGDCGRSRNCGGEGYKVGDILTIPWGQLTLATYNKGLLPSITTDTVSLTRPTRSPYMYEGLSTTTSGSGTGAILSVTASNDGTVSDVAVTGCGTGYQVGDTLTVSLDQLPGSETPLVITLVEDDLPMASTRMGQDTRSRSLHPEYHRRRAHRTRL